MPTTHVIADRVRQQTTTAGTGTLSLGAVPTGCRGVVAGVGSGKKARYSLVAETGGGWEVGEGTATAGSPDTFTRDVVYSSSAGGTTKITLPAGTHTLDVTVDAKSANEMTPRLLGIGNGVTLSAGTLAVDCMGSCDVLVAVALTANVTAVAPSNVPERCTVQFWVTHSGGPWTFPQGAWPAGTTLHGSYNLYTDGTITRFWLTTADGGATWILECNAPAGGSTGDAYAASHEADATAHPASSIVNTPAGNIAATTVQGAINELDSEKAATGHNHSGVYEPTGAVATHAALTQAHGISVFGATLVDDADAATARATLGLGTAATAATGDFAPAAQGVTNGNSHDHSGGDGATIAYSSLSGTPTITAAAQTVLDDATVAAMVDTLGGATSTGTGGLVRATSPTLTTPALGTPASGTLTNCSGLPASGLVASTSVAIGVGSIELGHASDTTLTRSAAGVAAVEGVPLGRVIASGTAALGTSAIASGASATVVTVAATGVTTTDEIIWCFNSNPNGVTGYNAASITGCLTITVYPTANNVNFLVSNSTLASITPGALTLNWQVVR